MPSPSERSYMGAYPPAFPLVRLVLSTPYHPPAILVCLSLDVRWGYFECSCSLNRLLSDLFKTLFWPSPPSLYLTTNTPPLYQNIPGILSRTSHNITIRQILESQTCCPVAPSDIVPGRYATDRSKIRSHNLWDLQEPIYKDILIWPNTDSIGLY